MNNNTTYFKRTKKSLLFFLILIMLGCAVPLSTYSQTYTLTDNDVVVVNGVIESCSYNFALTDIIIPDVLDGQTIIGIADGFYPVGVFSEKGITSIVLPSTIQTIGQYAFCLNQISTLDLSIYPQLTAINYQAFKDNNINTLNLSGCSSLILIGGHAFFNNSISVLDLSDCINLNEIGGGAFYYNNMIDLDLTGCANLQIIGNDAFRSNTLTNKLDLSLCQNLVSINNCAFMNNQIDTLSYPNSLLSIGIGAFTNNNIVVVNNLPSEGYIYNIFPDGTEDSTYLNSYGGVLDTITIPEMVTKIGRRAFNNCAIGVVDFNQCVNLTSIEYNALSNNQIDSLDLSACTKLQSIGPAAFASNNLVYVNLTNCDSLEIIDHESFLNNSLSNIDLTNCLRLSHVGYRAFEGNYLDSIDLTNCSILQCIGEQAFDGNPMSGFILPTTSIPDSTLVGWEDSNGGMHAGGETVTDLITYYDALFTETIDYTITFTVTDGTNPIENANINLAGYGDQITDASGIATFTDVLPEDNINYTVTATDYDNNTDSLSVVDADVNENVLLTLSTYHVTFVIEDVNGSLENATVNLTGYGTQLTNASGVAVFTEILPENDIVYSVIAAGHYDITDSLSVINMDVSDSVFMSLITYSVTFNISDGTSPVPDATVDLVGYGSQLTDNLGVAVFDSVGPDTDINYSVFCSGYIGHNDSITVVDSDVVEDVILAPAVTSYAVTFTVTDGINAISDATITLTGYGSQLTNNQGITVFSDVSPGTDIPYSATASGYNIVYGYVTVIDENIEENVSLTLLTYKVTFELSDGYENIAGGTVTLEGYGSQISNNDGIVVFNDVVPDLLNYTVAVPLFIDVSGAVEIVNDDVYENILLTPTGVNNYDNKQITVSPNPANSYVNITNCINKEVRIFNSKGQLLDRTVAYSNKYKVDISDLPSGILFIQIDSSVFKIIKK